MSIGLRPRACGPAVTLADTVLALPALALTVAIAVSGAPALAADAPRAAGGRAVLAASESASAVLVGRTENVRKLDLHGYSAELVVEQALTGEAKAGQKVTIAWEELASGRAVRFGDQDRVLVVLAPLPNHSLWKKRFTDHAGGVFAIARDGDAFLRAPDGPSLYSLSHYLALGRRGRKDPAGLSYLARMLAEATPTLALEAADRLAESDDLDKRLPSAGLTWLLRTLDDPRRPLELRKRTLLLIATGKLSAARDSVAEHAAEGSALRPEALAALAELDGGLDQKTVRRLLADPDPALRAVGAAQIDGETTDLDLARLVAADPAPGVRTVAALRLVERNGIEALDKVLPLLGDEDPIVRSSVARAVAALGEKAVEAVAEFAESADRRGAQGAVLALSFAGGEGARALVALSENHRDDAVRSLATLALGRAGGHSH